MDNEPKDIRQEKLDMLSDSSTMYWRRKRYYKEQNAEYLQGISKCGLRYQYHTKSVLDNKIKGELVLEYAYV